MLHFPQLAHQQSQEPCVRNLAGRGPVDCHLTWGVSLRRLTPSAVRGSLEEQAEAVAFELCVDREPSVRA